MMTIKHSLSLMHTCPTPVGLSTWLQFEYTRAIKNSDNGGSE